MSVRLVVVSHSAALAGGVIDLATQMAPDVDLVAAGGAEDGGLGTSFDRVTAALADPPPDGVVVLYDLGSALLTAETALEFADDPAAVSIVDAPLVEGTLAAAVAAQGGADRAAVAAAAAAAATAGSGDHDADPQDDAGPVVRRTATLVDPLGLHARPAADLAARVARFAARVRVGPVGGDLVDAGRVLDVVGLRLRGGDDVRIEASGRDADAAVGAAAGSAAFASVSPLAGTTPAVERGGSPGRAVGPLARAGAVRLPPAGPVHEVATERDELETAVDRTAARLRRGGDMARMHAALLDDPGLRGSARAAVTADRPAAHAWWTTVAAVADGWAGSGDEVLAARAADVRDAGAAMLRELGVEVARVPDTLTGCVLAADDLGPGEIGAAAERGAAGVVLAGGSPTAHAVVVARGLGLPLVLGAGNLLDAVPVGTVVAIDGATGEVVVDPPDAVQRAATIADARRARDAERAASAAPVQVGGRRIVVAANVGSVAEARAAVREGADAVGLLRTELLMLDRESLPDEDEQTAALTEILDVLGGRPVVVRVLDAGGDKPVRALPFDPQRNGFLGVRGLRWLLTEPAVLHTQLRAVCRAAAGHDVSVMAPMVSVAAEAVAFRQAADAAVASLVADGRPHAAPTAVGVMIEVPAAALAADEIADVVDFVSLGTNDLTSYVMAADRTEPGVAALLDPHSTALWRVLELACSSAAGRAGVAVCGELAAVPMFAARFVGLGVDELSMAPAAIPDVKAHLRGLDHASGE